MLAHDDDDDGRPLRYMLLYHDAVTLGGCHDVL
jgi:hypothetical protein